MQAAITIYMCAVEKLVGRIAPRLVPVRADLAEIGSADAAGRNDDVVRSDVGVAVVGAKANSDGAAILEFDPCHLRVEHQSKAAAVRVDVQSRQQTVNDLVAGAPYDVPAR